MRGAPLSATVYLQKPLEICVERIQDQAGFRALQHCWNPLLQESAASTVFLTWELVSLG